VLTLRFGPRPYKDYIKATKALDGGPINVVGRISNADGEPIAFCSTDIQKLETPNNILSPRLYLPALRRMVYTDIPVECLGGPVSAQTVPDGVVSVGWRAEVTLQGDRHATTRSYEGTASSMPLLAADDVSVPRMSFTVATDESSAESDANQADFDDYVDRTLAKAPVVKTSEVVVMTIGALLMLMEIVVLWPSRHKRMDRFAEPAETRET